MTQTQRPYPKFPEQNANGVDLSLIRSNMRFSGTERLRRADREFWAWERLRTQLPEQVQRIHAQLRARRYE